MLDIKQSLNRVNLTASALMKKIETEKEPTELGVLKTLAKQCLEAHTLSDQDVWVAPMKNGNCRLANYHQPKDDPLIQLAETYIDQVGEKHLRIYLHPQEDRVDAIFIGGEKTLHENTFWEKLPIHSLTDDGFKNKLLEIGVKNPLELAAATSKMLETSLQAKKLFGLIRPTSRVLAAIKTKKINGVESQVNYYQNQIDKKDLFFLLVSPINEEVIHGSIQRILITNDPKYRENQSRLDWVNLDMKQS